MRETGTASGGGHVARRLMRGVRACGRRRALRLAGNDIGSEGMLQLARTLPQCAALEQL